MKFKRKVYEIHSDKLNNGQQLSVILLSDLHLAEYGEDNLQLLQEIKAINPDVVLIAGDMVTAKVGYDTKVAENLLIKLALEYPIYYGMGNHEERLRTKVDIYGTLFCEYIKKLKMAGVIILDNENVSIDIHGISVCIFGLQLPLSYYQRMTNIHLETEVMKSLLGKPAKDAYNILLAHHPRYADAYFEWGADLILSGHIHGGVMRLGTQACVSPDLSIFPKFGYGKYDQGHQIMIVSGGLGEHTIPFRIFNPKELVHIVIK